MWHLPVCNVMLWKHNCEDSAVHMSIICQYCTCVFLTCSPLADVKLPLLNKKPQPKKVTKKPVLQLPLGVRELRELAHFEDDQSALEVLHWLKKET